MDRIQGHKSYVEGVAWPILLCLLGLGPSPDGKLSLAGEESHRATWHGTASFIVVSNDPRVAASDVANQAESLRDSLQQKWFPGSSATGIPWSPRCEVTIHATESDYLGVVGWQAAMTRGTCRISYHEGRVTNRQIHLCLDSVSGRPTALGHEITHVVFADHFSERHLPRWADEGIAMLSDLPEKKEMFRRAVRRAIENRSCLTLTRVLQERDYPASSRMPVFYSQSLSLVEFLAELDAPARILDFVRLSQTVGYEDAVRRVYRLESMAELERLWRDRTSAGLSTGI